MTAAALSSARVGRWLPAAAAIALSAAIISASVSVHLRQSCALRDTPYLPLCPTASKDPQEAQDAARQRIARNPGDAWAWTRLLLAQGEPRNAAVLRGAATLAPNNANVLRWRASEAIERGNAPEAVALLIQILKARGSTEAADVLAQLLASPAGTELFQPHLHDAKYWLPRVLASMSRMKMPPGIALPLVAEAIRSGSLPEETRRAYMQALKAGGYWVDAYGLWLATQRREIPLLYNGGFEHPFEQGGFDWEFTPVTRSRAGVILEQHAVARRGMVLQLEFTGRGFASPVLRQYVFAPPGSYRLRGDYVVSKMRSESGLAWNVLCTGNGKTASIRPAILQETGGVWRTLELEFTITEDCGPVASLQLEPAAAYEARTGIKGKVEFDAFSLSRSAMSQ